MKIRKRIIFNKFNIISSFNNKLSDSITCFNNISKITQIESDDTNFPSIFWINSTVKCKYSFKVCQTRPSNNSPIITLWNFKTKVGFYQLFLRRNNSFSFCSKQIISGWCWKSFQQNFCIGWNSFNCYCDNIYFFFKIIDSCTSSLLNALFHDIY